MGESQIFRIEDYTSDVSPAPFSESARELRTKHKLTAAQVSNSVLCVCNSSDFAQGKFRAPFARRQLFLRTCRHLSATYGNPLLVLILSAVIYEVVVLCVQWLWNHFVKKESLSDAAGYLVMDREAPHLNALGRAA